MGVRQFILKRFKQPGPSWGPGAAAFLPWLCSAGAMEEEEEQRLLPQTFAQTDTSHGSLCTEHGTNLGLV